jgi:hypothetical protein
MEIARNSQALRGTLASDRKEVSRNMSEMIRIIEMIGGFNSMNAA